MSGAQNNMEANFTNLALYFHLLKSIIKPAYLWSDNKYLNFNETLKVHRFTFYSLPHFISQYTYSMNLSLNYIIIIICKFL